MSIPSIVNYPTQLDSDQTLFGDVTNQAVFTLASELSAGAQQFTVTEDISALQAPLVMIFQSGETVYVEAKNNGLKLLSSVTRGSVPQAHPAGELVYATVFAEWFTQTKRAILAIQTTLGIDPGAGASLVSLLANQDSAISTLNTSIARVNGKFLASQPPSGTISPFAGPAIPDTWLLCDGSRVSKALYPALSLALGTTYGYYGETDFALPDLRGRVVVEDPAAGNIGGEELVDMDHNYIPSHTHQYDTLAWGGYDFSWQTGGTHDWEYQGQTTSSAGFGTGGSPHNNMQPYLALKYIIKA